MDDCILQKVVEFKKIIYNQSKWRHTTKLKFIHLHNPYINQIQEPISLFYFLTGHPCKWLTIFLLLNILNIWLRLGWINPYLLSLFSPHPWGSLQLESNLHLLAQVARVVSYKIKLFKNAIRKHQLAQLTRGFQHVQLKHLFYNIDHPLNSCQNQTPWEMTK